MQGNYRVPAARTGHPRREALHARASSPAAPASHPKTSPIRRYGVRAGPTGTSATMDARSP